MNNSDFSINIQIGLENQGKQLINEWEKIKKQITDDKLTVSFGDSINNSLKQITQVSNQITNLSKQVSELNSASNKKIQLIDSQNFINQINEVTKSVKSLKEIKSELSSLGDLKIRTGEIDDGGMRTFIATVKDASNQVAQLQFRLKEGIQGNQDNSLYKFEGFKSFTDGTTKVLNDLDKFKSEYKEKLNELKNTDVLDNNSISKFEEQLNGLNINNFKANVDNIKSSFKEMEDQYKSTINSIVNEDQRIRKLGSNVGDFNSTGLNMNSSIQEIQKYVQQTVGAKASVSSLVESEDKLGNSIKTANVSVNEGNNIYTKYKLILDETTQSAYKSSESTQNLSSKYGDLSDQIINNTLNMMKWMTSATLIFGSYEKLSEAISYVEQMDNALTDLNKVVDLNKSQLEDMKQNALEMGQSLGKSSIDIMNAMAEAGRQFKDTNDIKTFTETAVMASNVTDMSAQQAAKSLTTVMQVFKQNIGDVRSDLDAFNEIQNNFRVSGEDLAHSIEKVGEAAAQTGTSMHELNGITTALIQATGLEGSEAGTSIRAILSRTFGLGKDGADGKGMKGLKEYAKVDVRDASGEFKSFNDILSQTHDAWTKMSKSQQMALAQAEGGTQHYSQFMTIMENWDTVIKATNTSMNSQNSAIQENEKYLSSSEGKLNQLKVSGEKLATDLFNSSSIKGFIDGLKNIVNGADKAVGTFGNLHTVLALVGTSVAIFKGTEILNFFKTLPELINLTNLSFIKYQATLAGWTATEIASMTATEGLKLGLTGLWTTMAANPLGLIALGITAVVVAMDIFGESTEKQIQKMTELSDKAKQDQKDVDDLQSSLNTLNELHSKTNLTTEDKTKLANINNELTDKYPELISYYDTESKSFQVSTDKLNELIKKKQELAMVENANSLQTAKSQADKAQKAIEDATEQLKRGTRKQYIVGGTEVNTTLSEGDRKKLTDTINENQGLLDKSNQIINQSTKFINDYIAEQGKLGKSQTDINKGLLSYGYSQSQINDAVKKTTDSTSQNTNVTKDNTNAKTANASATKTQAESQEDLQKSFSASKDNLEFYNKVLKEMNDNGHISLDTAEEIISKHSDLAPYLTNEGELYKHIQQSIKDESKTAEDTILKMMGDSTQFYNETLSNNSEYFKSLKDNYGINAKDYKSYTDFITNMNSTMLENLLGDWRKYYSSIGEALQAQEADATNGEMYAGMHMTGDPTHDAKYIDEANEANKKLKQIQDAKKIIDDTKSLFENSTGKYIDTLNGSSDALDKNKSKTKENTEAQKALELQIKAVNNEMKNYENQLKAIDVSISSLDTNLQGLDDSSESYREGLRQEIELFKQRNSVAQNAINTNGQLMTSVNNMTSLSGASLGQEVVAKAEQYLGTPYKYGGKDPLKGIDCSGLVTQAFSEIGVDVSGSTYQQIQKGQEISKDQLQPGDLVFFGSPSDPHHVGIYAGNNSFVEAPHTGANVRISSLDNRSDYLTARRIVSDSSPTFTSSSSSSSEYSGDYSEQINKASDKYGVPTALIAAIIKAESDFRNLPENSSGAMGVMQVTRGSAQDNGFSNADLMDVSTNIMAGTAELAKDLKTFGGDYTKAIAAYNAGIGAVQNAGGVPNYSETKAYVPKVLQYLKEYGGTDKLEETGLSSLENIMSKTQDLQKGIIDYNRKIIETYTKLYESQNKYYDSEITKSNKLLENIKGRYTYYEENVGQNENNANVYKEEEWKEINNQYLILTQKEAFIKSQMSSNIYDEKTLVSMKDALQNVQLEEEKTKNQLHDSFKEWLADRLNVRTLDQKNSIENYNNQLSLLNEQDSGYSDAKVSLNEKVLEQQRQITDSIREQLGFVSDLYSKEAYGVTRTLWAEEIRKLNNQLIQAQTEIEKVKKQLEEATINKILDETTQKLRLINDNLKEIETNATDIGDTDISSKLIDSVNKATDYLAILKEDTASYNKIFAEVGKDGIITSDELKKLDEAKTKVDEDRKSLVQLKQDMTSLNLENILLPFSNAISQISDKINALDYQLSMLGTTDNKEKSDLIAQKLGLNQTKINDLMSEYNKLSNVSAEAGSKEGESLANKLKTVRDSLIEASKEGKTLRQELQDASLQTIFSQIQKPQDKISTLESNIEFQTSMPSATQGLLLGNNFMDTSEYKSDSEKQLDETEKITDIIDGINEKISDLNAKSYDISIDNVVKSIKDGNNSVVDVLQNIKESVDNLLDKNNETVKQKMVYGSGDDKKNFEFLSEKYGISNLFKIIDTNSSEFLQNRDKFQITSNDVVLGARTAIGGISDENINGAKRLPGVDAENTKSLINGYLKSIVEKLNQGNGTNNSSEVAKNNEVMLNKLDIGNATSENIATNTGNDVVTVQAQTSTLSANNDNNAKLISDNLTNNFKDLDSIVADIKSNLSNLSSIISSIKDLESNSFGQIIEKMNSFDMNNLLQELINIHSSLNSLGNLVAQVNSSEEKSVSFNGSQPISLQNNKDKKEVDKKAFGSSGTDGSAIIVGDGEGANSGYELAVLPNGRVVKVGENGFELIKPPKGTQIVSHIDSKKILEQGGGVKDIPKCASGTIRVFAKSDPTIVNGLPGDFENASKLISDLGRNDIKVINVDDESDITSSDLVLGGTSIISNELANGAKRIYGEDRYETSNLFKSWVAGQPIQATSDDIQTTKNPSTTPIKPSSNSKSDYNEVPTANTKPTNNNSTSDEESKWTKIEDTDFRKSLNKDITNIQSQYTDKLKNGASNNELLEIENDLIQRNILLNQDSISQLKQKEKDYADNSEALQKITQKEQELNQQLQESQKKLIELAKEQVDAVTAINDAKEKQLETQQKLVGSTSTSDELENDKRKVAILKNQTKELENYKDELNKLNVAGFDEKYKLGSLDLSKSNLSSSDIVDLRRLLIEQAQNGYLSDSDSAKLTKLEASLSDTDKTTLLSISSKLADIYNKTDEVNGNIVSKQDEINSQEYSMAQQVIENNKKLDEAQFEQSKKDWSKQLFNVSESDFGQYKTDTIAKLQKEKSQAQESLKSATGEDVLYYQDEILAKSNEIANISKQNYADIYDWESTFEKVHNHKIEQLEEENEEEQKKEASLKRQNELLELQKELNDALNQKIVQTLTKDKEGNWQFQYVADMTKVDDLQKQIGEKMKDNADADKQQKIADEKKYEQDLINTQKEAYEKLVNDQQHILTEKYSDMNYLVDSYLKDIKSKVGNDSSAVISMLGTELSISQGKLDDFIKSVDDKVSEMVKFIQGLEKDSVNNSDLDTKVIAYKNDSDVKALEQEVWNGGSDSLEEIHNKMSQIAKDRYGIIYDTNTGKWSLASDTVKNSPTNYNNMSDEDKKSLKSKLSSDSEYLALRQKLLYASSEQEMKKEEDNIRQYTISKYGVTFDTGGYTGTWGNDGKAAILHEKELVLNKDDTKNTLEAIEQSGSLLDKLKAIGSSITSSLNLSSIGSGLFSSIKIPNIDASMMNNLSMPNWNSIGLVGNSGQSIEQSVVINADFSGVKNHTEIETAMNNLINGALQYAK